MSTQTFPLSQCATVTPGYSTKGAVVHDLDGTHQVIMAKHLTVGEPYRYFPDHELRVVPHGRIDNYLLRPGDILFMSRGATNYAVLLEAFPQPAIAPSTFYLLRPREGVDPAYLVWCLGQQPVLNCLAEIRTGAGMPMIPRPEFAATPIPLPPLDIQRTIARLAASQAREKTLRRQLLEETETQQRVLGQAIFQHLTTDSNRSTS